MGKSLSEMTIEELWQLFPITLTEHQGFWSKWYEEERELLRSLLPHDVIINHIGSTAINGIRDAHKTDAESVADYNSAYQGYRWSWASGIHSRRASWLS